jgi:hypothetical protein
MTSSSSSHISQSGLDKVVFKFFYDDPSVLRRVSYSINEISFEALFYYCLIQFSSQINPEEKDSLSLRYTDSEGD